MTFPAFTRLTLCFAAVAWLKVAVHAQGGPPPWAGGGAARDAAHAAPGDTSAAEFAALDRFLAMSDAELDAMRQAIERVRAMSPREREEMRAQIAAFQQLPPERRDEIRVGWGWHDPQDRRDWRAMMHAKTPEERSAIQRELLPLEPAARQARKAALLEAWRRERAPQGSATP